MLRSDDFFESGASPPARPAAAPAAKSRAPIDVGAKLRRMWR